MTQLFDTNTYDTDEIDGQHGPQLRSISGGASFQRYSRADRWRLDDTTIKIGRKGIQAARNALRATSLESDVETEKQLKTARRAA